MDQISDIITPSQEYTHRSGQVLYARINPQGDILYWNRALRQQFDIPFDQAPGKLDRYLLPEGDDDLPLIGGFGQRRGLPTMFYSVRTHRHYLFHVYEEDDELHLFGSTVQMSDDRQVEMLSELTTEMGNLVREVRRANRELNIANEQITELARTDSLTGLANRRYFLERAEISLAHTARHDRPIALVIMDLDLFKQINDQFGHQAGDRVLQLLGKLLLDAKRAADIAARHGGEEFVVLLPDTDLQGASLFAERLRAAMEAALPLGANHPVTLSLGVAQRIDGEDIDSLTARADGALYAAKNGGRNQVSQAR